MSHKQLNHTGKECGKLGLKKLAYHHGFTSHKYHSNFKNSSGHILTRCIDISQILFKHLHLFAPCLFALANEFSPCHFEEFLTVRLGLVWLTDRSR